MKYCRTLDVVLVPEFFGSWGCAQVFGFGDSFVHLAWSEKGGRCENCVCVCFFGGGETNGKHVSNDVTSYVREDRSGRPVCGGEMASGMISTVFIVLATSSAAQVEEAFSNDANLSRMVNLPHPSSSVVRLLVVVGPHPASSATQILHYTKQTCFLFLLRSDLFQSPRQHADSFMPLHVPWPNSTSKAWPKRSIWKDKMSWFVST